MKSDLQRNRAWSKHNCLGENYCHFRSCPGREGLDVVFKDWSVVEEPKPREYKKLGVGDIINTILLISSLSWANGRLNFTGPYATEQGHMTSDGQRF